MLAMLLNEKEIKEMQYLLKREMDEILYDLRDERIDMFIKTEMEERYKHLFMLFKRVAPPVECMKYILTYQKGKRKEKNYRRNKKSN
ncbi:hypothetical protein R4Z10_00890 [Niallia sp. XMNu-256]|uniref:hypothetical protein n=1 Tax=Niallia sp. XMNu-256 TaxID=3082444 RepID=UPI0030D62A37